MQTQAVALHHQLAQAHLPSMPQILVQLLDFCDRDDVGIVELSGLVAKDAAVSAKVIGIANSSYYRRTQILDGLDQCVVVLGSEAVRSVVLNHAIREMFGRFRGTRELDLRRFWLHTLRCAVLAKQLARHFHYPNPDEAYLAGLLHDVGRLALLAVAAERYAPLLEAHGDEDALRRSEREAFGLDHAEIGAWLAERWQMHPFFVDSLLYHHETAERIRSAHPLVRIVALANVLSTSPVDAEAVSAAFTASWSLAPEAMLSLMTEADQTVRSIANQFGIDLPDDPDAPEGSAQLQAASAKLAESLSDRLQAVSAFPSVACDKAPDEARLMLAQGTRLLFGPCAVALFTPEDGLLRGEGLDAAGLRLDEIGVSIEDADSTIARAWRGEVAATGSQSVVDAQVRRLMGAAALMALRLGGTAQRAGVMVLGIDPDSARALKGRTRLLAVFAREAGRFLLQSGRQQERLAQARDEAVEGYVAHARRIVHEVGNPLSVVRNYLSILKDQLATQDRQNLDISLLEDELRRVGRILEGLKNPAPQAVPVAVESRVDLNGLVDEVVRFCQQGKTAPLGIVLEAALEPALPAARGDADKIKQILINLVFNAAEALSEGGRITIASAVWRGADGMGSAELTVSDNGPGLPAEVLERLYRPVQTQKGGGHSGLGLSIVKGLVDEMGGTLQCRSGSSGTTFKILLPLAA